MNFIKIIGYKQPYNIKINNTIINKETFIKIVEDVLKNIITDYNSCYYVIKLNIYSNLEQLKQTNNKKQLYYYVEQITTDLKEFDLKFK